ACTEGNSFLRFIILPFSEYLKHILVPLAIETKNYFETVTYVITFSKQITNADRGSSAMREQLDNNPVKVVDISILLAVAVAYMDLLTANFLLLHLYLSILTLYIGW
ncbi:hypothetical protein ACJX0J_012313, partial [Zea mays]